jgi:hypothetical protein
MLKKGIQRVLGGRVILWALVEVTGDWRRLRKEEPTSQHTIREMGEACEGKEKCIWGFGRNP